MTDVQWSTKSETTQAFLSGSELGTYPLDELRANVKKEEEHAMWVWTVCESKTKIIPVFQLGARSQQMAYTMVVLAT
jgi:hypothetical protein